MFPHYVDPRVSALATTLDQKYLFRAAIDPSLGLIFDFIQGPLLQFNPRSEISRACTAECLAAISEMIRSEDIMSLWGRSVGDLSIIGAESKSRQGIDAFKSLRQCLSRIINVAAMDMPCDTLTGSSRCPAAGAVLQAMMDETPAFAQPKISQLLLLLTLNKIRAVFRSMLDSFVATSSTPLVNDSAASGGVPSNHTSCGDVSSSALQAICPRESAAAIFEQCFQLLDILVRLPCCYEF